MKLINKIDYVLMLATCIISGILLNINIGLGIILLIITLIRNILKVEIKDNICNNK